MKTPFFTLSAALMLIYGCSGKQEFVVPEQSEIIGLASVITLPADTGTIDLMDFFEDVSRIDSLGRVEGLELKPDKSFQTMFVKVDNARLKPYSELRVWSKGQPYSLILRKSVKQAHKVVLKSIPTAVQSVQLAGDINNWQPNLSPLEKKGAAWETTLLLNPGRYSYQVVVDGKWMLDPENADSTSNGMGGFNSVMIVPGADDTRTPFLSTVSADRNKVVVSCSNKADELLVFWENFRIPNDYIETSENTFSIKLPDGVSKVKRSALRMFAYNEAGAGNDLMIPLMDGKVVTEASALPRDDFRSAILYFMMVDRFYDGDTSNNQPVLDPRVDYKANYQGGDLQGIRKKLEEGYFKDLGVNTLWISPIVQNPEGAYQEYPEPRRWFSGYHGYWPVNTTVVDHRLGSNAVFGELVDKAHNANMNVLVDFVSNHVHSENKLYTQHPEWFSSMYTKDGKVNIRIWDAERLTTWFDTFMPDIDYTKPEAVNAFTDSAMFWLEKYKIDGFRHDATKHVSEVFWRALTRKMKNRVVKNEGRNVYQIGETFGSRELIGSYISSGMLDAQFDFNLYFDARPVFASGAESFEKVASSLKESALYYGHHSTMGNITGNHDMPRFLYYAGGAYRQGEDEKEAGWNREIKVEDPKGYSRLKMLHAFIMTIPGIPVIYYGDEIGMTGANDPDNRRMMRFSGLSAEEQDIKNTVKKLTTLRKSSMPLLYGSTRVLSAGKDVLVYQREYLGKSVIVALNRAESPNSVEVNVSGTANVKSTLMGGKAELSGQKLKFTVNPLSFEIITLE